MASHDLIQVNLYAAARAAARTSTVHVPAGTLAAVLGRAVEKTQPELAEVVERCSFLLDGLAVHGDPETVPVEPGQHVDVLPPFAGG